jgi:hypothetical protein
MTGVFSFTLKDVIGRFILPRAIKPKALTDLYRNKVKDIALGLDEIILDKDDEDTVIWVNPLPYLNDVFIDIDKNDLGYDMVLRVRNYDLPYYGWDVLKVFYFFEEGNPAYNIEGFRIFEQLKKSIKFKDVKQTLR